MSLVISSSRRPRATLAAMRAIGKLPGVRVYQDWRELLGMGGGRIDSVNITIPDHMHATVALWAMERGLGVYCQKPLTHTVYEARQMAVMAKKMGVATQMGNQAQAGEGARLICEYIQSGAIGTVLEVHAGSNRRPPISPRGIPWHRERDW